MINKQNLTEEDKNAIVVGVVLALAGALATALVPKVVAFVERQLASTKAKTEGATP